MNNLPKLRYPCAIAILWQTSTHSGDWRHIPYMSFHLVSVLVGHICKNRQGIRILTLPCFSPIFLLSLWILVLAWDPECDTTQQLPQWLSSNVDGQPSQFPPGPSKANRALSLILTGSPRDTTGLPMADCRFLPHMWISKLISLPEWRPMKYLITELSFSW